MSTCDSTDRDSLLNWYGQRCPFVWLLPLHPFQPNRCVDNAVNLRKRLAFIADNIFFFSGNRKGNTVVHTWMLSSPLQERKMWFFFLKAKMYQHKFHMGKCLCRNIYHDTESCSETTRAVWCFNVTSGTVNLYEWGPELGKHTKLSVSSQWKKSLMARLQGNKFQVQTYLETQWEQEGPFRNITVHMLHVIRAICLCSSWPEADLIHHDMNLMLRIRRKCR